MNNNTYEIHDLTTKEILVDGLSFDDVAEQMLIYIEFYSSHNIVVCQRCDKAPKQPQKLTYKQEFINYMELIIDNLY